MLLADTTSVGVAIKRLTSLALLLFLALTIPPSSTCAQSTVLSGAELLAALRAGGNNIYFRHAQTDWSQDDHIDKAGDWTSCDPAKVRQLSAQGRRVATGVGESMRALGIPVGQVLASPYCRTVQTAELMALGPVTTTTDVMNLRVAQFFGGSEAIIKRARARLAMPPPSGKNAVIVAHGNVARDATPVYPDEAEAVILRPDGDGGFVLLGRVKPADWQTLSRAAGDPTPQ